ERNVGGGKVEETKQISPIRTMQTHFGKDAEHMFRKYIAHMESLANCKSAEDRKKITDEMVREGLDPSVLSLLSSASKTFDISAHPPSSTATSFSATTTSSSSSSSSSSFSSFPISELQQLTKQRDESQPKQQQKQQESSSTTTTTITSAKEKKYLRMLKAGVPLNALKLRMEQDGVDSDIIRKILSQVVQAKVSVKQKKQVQNKENNKKLSNFSKMLKMGVPKGAVAARMIAAGLDPSTLCGPEFATGQTKNRDNKKGKDIKVKRLFWDALDEDDLMEKDTIWSQLDDDQEEEVVGVKNIHLDLDRMRSLFMKLPSPAKSSRLFKKKKNKQRRRSMQEIRLVNH
ncbi:MAG: hypothetical protein VX417_02115, partial [SAR324 cluster bacterium]|nr:hypothetical protein [SAR324 cluster bacterium]